ncbi:MAG: efflux RND transporter periplasmic adaptor subunit, partial [Candidatus Caenarcaniphilales bacterium]|nr:efflux RND transporter periplasmic adaptor subunit [Candidatus Caenarcaniphilales bacterium]
IIIFIAIIVVGSHMWWASNKQKNDSLVVSGTLQAAEVQFGSRQGGRVKEVLVEEGQLLTKQQVILNLENDELVSQRNAVEANSEAQSALIKELTNGPRAEELEQARSSYKQSKATYDLTKNGNRVEDINTAKATMESALSEKQRAEQYFKRREALFKEQLITTDQLEEAKKNLTVAEKRYEEAKQQFTKSSKGSRKEEIEESYFNMKSREASYQNLAKGTRSEKIEAERSKLESLKSQLSELDSKVNELEVKSPCYCELGDFEIEPGDLILANQVLGVLIDLNNVWVEAYLPEEVYGKVWPGDKVSISSLTYPGKKFVGKIKHVGLKSEFTPRNIQTIEGRKQQVFKVKVSLDNSKKLFRPGMDLEMRFNFKERKADDD